MSATNELFDGIVPFVHVAEERSFRRAAARLGVTTAAVSKAIQRLEAEVGVALLLRTSRSVTITREGEAFLAHCREAVRAVGAAREEAKDARRRPRGEVHLTMSPVLATPVVRELPRLSERHPALRFRITVSDRLLRVVEEGIDVALRLGAPEDSSLVGRLLRQPRWVTVAAPRYLARAGTPATVAELARHACLRFVGPNGKPRSFWFVDHTTGTGRAHTVDGPLLVDQGERLLDASLAGMGICQVLDLMVEEHLREGRLVEVLAQHAAPGPEIHALYARDRARSANVRVTVSFLAEIFGPPGDRRPEPISLAER
jgi:LysR family transcriptional regulator for bpeEF and oprC